MKIVFFTDHFVPEISAPAAHIYDRCKIWVKQGHEVTVVTNIPNYPLGKPYKGYKNYFRSWETLDGIRVLRVGTYMAENKGTIKRTLDYISYMTSSFINSLNLKRPDVVYSTSPHIFAPLGAICFSVLRRVPHVVEIRDLWPESISGTIGMKSNSIVFRLFHFIEMLIYKKSKKIVVFTESFKLNLIKKGIKSEKIHVVINGANTTLFSSPEYDEDLALKLNLKNKFVIGYFGTHGLSHGLLNAIHTAAILQKEDIHFLFVGEGAEKSLMMQLVEKHGLNNVHFIGQQPRENIPVFWGLCDIGLVHLKNDPIFETVIPSKIFETMAAGKPILYCGPESDGSRLIVKHNAGLIALPENPNSLAEKIRELKNNQNLCESLGYNGKKASNIFSRKNQAKKTIKVLELVKR